MLDMLEYYNTLRKLNVNIIYSGPVWTDGIEGIAETLKKRLEFDALPLSASQSVFSVFVEQMNNILMYSESEKQFHDSEKRQLEDAKGVFVLGVRDKSYFVQSGNIMKIQNVEMIKKRIDYINTMDNTELRKYYKEQIKAENNNPESKGAGLGLIEIARRSSSKLEYSFDPYGDGLTFFTMFVTIGPYVG